MKSFRFVFSLVLILIIVYLLVKVNGEELDNEYISKAHLNIVAISMVFLVLFPDFFSFLFLISGIVLAMFCTNAVCVMYSLSLSILGVMSFIFGYRFFYVPAGYHYYCPNCDQYLGSHISQCPLCGSTNVKKEVFNLPLYLIYLLKKKVYFV